jgi:Na+:H+ antiporter
MADLHASVALLVGLLAAALLIGVVAVRVQVPYSVALLVAALPLSLPGTSEFFGPSLLLVFLPTLIFEAAWNLDASAAARRWIPIAVLAVPGVALTTLVVGAGLAAAGLLPLVPALLLGAILAATDPIAVIPVFRRIAVPDDLAAIVEGESLFNDGTAIVLYGVLVALVAGGGGLAALHPSGIVLEVAAVSLGGAAIGFVAAVLVTLLLRGVEDVSLALVGTVVAAYGGYLAADALHVSGIFGAVVAGVALRAFERFPWSERAGAAVGFFWEALAYFAASFVFIAMGLAISLPRIAHEPLLVVLTLLLVSGARLVLAYGGLPLCGIRDLAWQHVVALAGMRGALSVALALGLPADLPYRAQIIDAVYGVVFVTLIVQGLAIGPLLRRLRLAPQPA